MLVGTIAGSASAQGEPIAEINGNKIYALDVHNAYAAERPEFVQKIRFDDNAARTLAMDWYRAQLFKQAAIDEGYHQANPATLPGLVTKCTTQMLRFTYFPPQIPQQKASQIHKTRFKTHKKRSP